MQHKIELFFKLHMVFKASENLFHIETQTIFLIFDIYITVKLKYASQKSCFLKDGKHGGVQRFL